LRYVVAITTGVVAEQQAGKTQSLVIDAIDNLVIVLSESAVEEQAKVRVRMCPTKKRLALPRRAGYR
jgi:hypothetical protein